QHPVLNPTYPNTRALLRGRPFLVRYALGTGQARPWDEAGSGVNRRTQMPRTIRTHSLGGPEVLQDEDLDLRAPGAGEVRILVEALALNRAEPIYSARRYPRTPHLPS